MKPLELELEGLQSYREPQTVDFARLGERGLFGIFGPTGAGKSTLLDALTLALYGEVDRAKSGKQGIAHPGAERVRVRLLFEAGADRRVCEVERIFRPKPGAEGGLDAKRVRFRKAREGGWDVADKTTDVNAAVREAVGLDAKDFKCAVVLPQGKFAEFLHQQGSDRRRMLERLLGLERYGEQLWQRVVRRAGEVEERLGRIEAERQGLGPASEEDLAAARAQLEQAREDAERARTALKGAAETVREASEIRAIAQEVNSLQDEEQRLEAGEAAMAALRAELAAALRAEGVRGLITERERAAGECARAGQSLEQASADASRADEAHAKARSALETATAERGERRPALEKRREELQEAVRLEADAKAVAARLSEAKAALKEKQGALRGSEQDVERGLVEKAAAEEELRAVKAELERARVDPAWRLKVQAAEEGLARLRDVVNQHAEAARVLEAKERAVKAARRAAQDAAKKAAAASAEEAQVRAAVEKHEAARPDSKELREGSVESLRLDGVVDAVTLRGAERDRIARRVENLGGQRGAALSAAAKLKAREQEAHNTLREAREHLALVRRKAEEALRHSEAARLAAELSAGTPCPVCGAIEHPRPASPTTADSEADELRRQCERAEKACDEAEAGLSEARAKAAGAQGDVEAAERALGEAQRELVEAEAAVAQAREGLPAEQGSRSVVELEAWRASARGELQRQHAEIERWEEARARLALQLEAVRSQAEAARRKADAEDARRSESERAACEAGETVATLDSTRAARSRELEERRGDLAVERIGAESAQIAQRDKAVASLERKRDAFETALRQIADRVADACASRERLAAEIQGLAREATALEGQHVGLTARVRERTGGRPPAEVLREQTDQLDSLDRAETQARQLADKAASARAAAQAGCADARARFEAASVAQRRAEEHLERELSARGLGSPSEASAALRENQVRAHLEQTVGEHDRARQRTAGALAAARARLCGRMVSDAQWSEAVARHEACEREAAESGSRLGQAQEAARALDLKHGRWRELAAESAGLVPQRDRLETLKSMLVGRAFVEFMAEQELDAIARDASMRLKMLTRGRYELALDRQSERNGGFVIRDGHNGGIERPVQSLSGGETFLASLALALALSTQIQLRGEQPIRFFFLDEGFGTLDPSVLDVALGALERLRQDDLVVGLITHVPEVRARLPRRLIVEPAVPGVRGSRVRIEEG